MSNKNVFTVSLDAGAIILDFNDTSSNISGYTKKELLGKNWFEIFIPDSNLVEVLGVFSDLFHGQNAHWEFTNNIRCKNGSTKTIKWVNNIIKDEKNRPTEIYSLGVVV
ncbi:PAS domain S-box protein [Sulfurimonas sp. CS5]|jgi:PAS domain S-box-containing protein|uniref:PAS domain S-box protein n=1 Tax=Sulfurimonas sp. CS5 TaxID=3391145 RepID=UPI0039E82E02